MNHKDGQLKNPAVTIVTVVFNDVKNLEKTMLSVLDQTFLDFEYIVIDGGSTDGTVDIIKKYAHRLAFWVSEKDKGIYDAMNKAIEKAQGSWINFMNSGDYFFDNTVLENIFSTSKYDGVDVLYGGFIGNFNGRSVLCSAPLNVKANFWKGMPICHNSTFVRTHIMQQFKFDTNFKVSADGDFISHCAAIGHVFERVDVIVFRVGTLGFSNANWLTARLENWSIARGYFPGVRTDFFHAQALVREVLFRAIKYITSLVGLYQVARFIYRKTIQKKAAFLPKGVLPFQE
jgi:glycosyltransferase involved in cell wall biosynthesis